MQETKHYCDICKVQTQPPFNGTVDLNYSCGGNCRHQFNSKEICLDCTTKIYEFIKTIKK